MSLHAIRSLAPHSASANSAGRSEARALHVFKEAAKRVPAYRDFLKKHGVRPSSVRTIADLHKLPVTDKRNYIQAYSLQELSWDGNLDRAVCVASSSGSTGEPYFWPRAKHHDDLLNLFKQQMLEGIIGTGRGTTLAVDSFALGQWIAGIEFHNGVRWCEERGNRITVVTPGIHKADAVRQIRMLAHAYDRVVLGGYPPFIKDILEEAALADVDWESIDVHFIAGGEAVSDVWKDRLLESIGHAGEAHRFITEYGMADCGVVAHETPVSAALRRSHASDPIKELPHPDQIVGLYQYYPAARYLETIPSGTLAVTTDAGLPLVRYDTRDMGKVLSYKEGLRLGGESLRRVAARYKADLSRWKLPFVYLTGRKDFAVTFYALNIYVEHLKRALEHSPRASHLSGLFTMRVAHDERLDQCFEVTIELARGIRTRTSLAHSLQKDIVGTLRALNSEYNKLYESVGSRADPEVVLVRHGEIQTIPGRKHRWFTK